MKKLLLASALVAGATFGLQELTFSHGGTYRGPGDTVPPGGGGGGGGGGPATPGPSGPGTPGPAGPGTPGPSGPGTPGAGPGGGSSSTTGGGAPQADLTAWTFWWEFNKEPYLNLKASIHAGGTQTGSDSFFLGQGEKAQAKDSLRPSEEQIRQKVVPALLEAVKNETNNDIVTGCLIALAKIGDVKDESGNSEFADAIKSKLSDSVQEISETAAVALGILANEASVPLLTSLLQDTPEGRALVKQGEVPLRTRAFAAYGLALIGARTAKEETRKQIIDTLASVLDSDKSSTRDVKVACLVALGLVPLEQIHPDDPAAETQTLPPSSSRVGQLEHLFRYYANAENHYLVRAHVPTALARLLINLPAEDHQIYKQRIADLLLEGFAKKSKEQREVMQSCILALGMIGDNDADAIDVKIRESLIEATKEQSDHQSRHFSLIALAQTGGRGGQGEAAKKDDVTKHLVTQLAKGKGQLAEWAGLAIGVQGWALSDKGLPAPPDATAALRQTFESEKNTSAIGAYSIGLGLLKDLESKETMLEHLEELNSDEALGYVTVALGLMGARDAIQPISELIQESQYRPDLLKQAAIGLGLLGDKEIVKDLVDMLKQAKAMSTQAALAAALGTIGDRDSIDPLVGMLQNKDLSDSARGFAAVALGIVADKEPLPWNTKISLDLNYLASTQTLNDPEGTGILNIL